MICRVGEAKYYGRAIHVSEPVDPERVARAVRTGAATTNEPRIEVAAPEPGPLHDRVGCIRAGMALRPRTALAAAGRSRGWTTEFDDELRAVRRRLEERGDGPDVPADPDARRREADSGEEIDRLRERVAAMRGRVAAAANPDEAAAALEDAIRSLSEVETAAAAARERRRAGREDAREARDRLQERLRLVDRRGNLERRARRALVERAREPYERALAAVPGCRPPADPFEAPPDAMALAIARVGDLEAPLVLAVDRFEGPEAAADWLDAPVIILEP